MKLIFAQLFFAALLMSCTTNLGKLSNLCEHNSETPFVYSVNDAIIFFDQHGSALKISGCDRTGLIPVYGQFSGKDFFDAASGGGVLGPQKKYILFSGDVEVKKIEERVLQVRLVHISKYKEFLARPEDFKSLGGSVLAVPFTRKSRRFNPMI